MVQVEGRQKANGEQEPASPTLQRQAAKGPQHKGQKRQRHRLRAIGPQEGIQELIRSVGVGHRCHYPGLRSEDVPRQQVGPQRGAQDAQDVDQVEGQREWQPGQMQAQGQVVGERRTVVEEWEAVAESQVRQPAGKKETLPQSMAHRRHPEVMEGPVVGARDLATEQRSDGHRAQQANHPTPKPKFGHFRLVIGHWSLVHWSIGH